QLPIRDHGRMQAPVSDVAGGPAPKSDVAGEAVNASAGPPSQPHRLPRVTSFRTRRSTLSGGQQETWDRLWPKLGMQARDEDSQPITVLDTEASCGRSAPLVLEIGSGTGTSTLEMAKAEPHIDVIAVEVYRKGLAQLLSAI